MKTINTLVFDQITYKREDTHNEYGNSPRIVSKWEATLNAFIEFRCLEHGELIYKINIICEKKDYDLENAIKLVIQGFFNYEYLSNTEMHDHNCGCALEKRGMHDVVYNVGEPYSSLLKQLYEKQNWTIQKDIPDTPIPTMDEIFGIK